jgi:hypothetical protein
MAFLATRKDKMQCARQSFGVQQQHGRYFWTAGGDVTSYFIALNYPHAIGAPFYPPVQPVITLTDQSGDLTFTFGWTDDGKHWVLFGVNDLLLEDARKIAEFPRLLRAFIEDDNIENPPQDGAAVRCRTRELRASAIRAYKQSETP